MNSYEERDKVLKELGFASYTKYLDSPLWKTIKTRVLLRNPRCIVCREVTEIVHHTSYCKMTMNGHMDKYLKPLCNACHTFIEFTSEGKKNSLEEANRKLELLLKKEEVVKPVNFPKKESKSVPVSIKPDYVLEKIKVQPEDRFPPKDKRLGKPAYFLWREVIISVAATREENNHWTVSWLFSDKLHKVEHGKKKEVLRLAQQKINSMIAEFIRGTY